MDGPLTALSIAAALGCALNAGVIFAFSSFVMQGLGRLRPVDGAAAMRSINVTAATPAFMTALFGTAALCLAVVAAGLGGLDDDYGGYLVAGGALYLAGPVVLTMAYHVPRNNELAEAGPDALEQVWASYLPDWTRWNHLRAAAALAGAGLIVAGIGVG